MTDRITVTKATLAELGTAIAAAGHSDMLTEDGTVACGELEFVADGQTLLSARATRSAQMIDDVAGRLPGDVVYQDADTEVSTRCRSDGVHVIEQTNGARREIVVPQPAVPILSAQLIDCMGKTTD